MEYLRTTSHFTIGSTKPRLTLATGRIVLFVIIVLVWAIEKFGHVIVNSLGQSIPTKMLAEQHVEEDCGFIPTPADYLKLLKVNPAPWMLRVKVRSSDIGA